MGIAAELRYVKFAANQVPTVSANQHLLDDLNAIPKKEGAMAPFGDILFLKHRENWVAECPVSGFGFFYKTLRDAVSSWRVVIFLDNGKLIGQPIK